jgi:Tfp pilus assembly protein PilX
MKNFFKKIKNNNQGQVMIVVAVALGGVMLGSTLVGGILILNQLRQVKNISDSAKAFYAADSALEWGYYQFIGKSGAGAPRFENGASSVTQCLDQNNQETACSSVNTSYIIGKGSTPRVSRALQMSF